MPKYFLPKIVCACLLVFSVPAPCVGQNPEDHDIINWIYPFTWDWGPGNKDIQGNLQWDLPRHIPQGVVARDIDLSGRDLRNARIHLNGGILRNINFDGANLEGADFTDTILENCSFRGANLKFVRLNGVPTGHFTGDVTDAIFSAGQLIPFDELGPRDISRRILTEEQTRSTWNFKKGDVIETMLRDGKIQIEDLRWDQLPPGYRPSGKHVFRTHEFRQKSLSGLTISGVDFSNCDFSGFSLGIFENCNFSGANFADAVILASDVFGYPPSSVPTFGFRECNITEEQLKQTRFWKRGDLTGLVLERMDLKGWDFSNKDLSFASFSGSSVRGANFENAVIFHTDLNVALMSTDGLLASEMQEQRRYSDSIEWTSTLTIEQLKQTRSWKIQQIIGCTFRRVNFDDSNLRWFDFSGGTVFIDCSFRHADLTWATIDFPFNRRNYGVTEQQLRSTRYFHENKLKPVVLWE